MAQNISLWGNTYSNVPSVLLPKSGGGNASFTDVTPTTATASDVANGKIFFTSSGVQTTGTASGGGGSDYALLASKEYTVNTSSTSEGTVGTINLGSSAYTSSKIIYVHIRDKSGKRSGRFYGNDDFLLNYYPKNAATTDAVFSKYCWAVNSSGKYILQISGSNNGYGVYAKSLNSSGVLTICRRYNSTYTLTINSTYTVDVYALNYPDGISPFA